MISIDTVYQKVLAFANKEQRGYITPQEFNLFADQAQKEIFEQYFYDMNQLTRMSGNDTSHSDIRTNLEEKLHFFEHIDKESSVFSKNGNTRIHQVEDLYRLTAVKVKYKTQTRIRLAEQVQLSELSKYEESPLGIYTKSRPVYYRYNKNGTTNLRILPTPAMFANSGDKVYFSFIKQPKKPSWGYVVVNGNAMYDPSNKTDFELHESEETELVYKILKFAGLSMRRDDLAKGGQGLETLQTNQEKQ